MASPLTERATPAELADRNQVIESKENILSFPRLAEILETELAEVSADDPAATWRQFPVAITLRFGWADSRHRFASLEGAVEAQVAAICQRCLRPFEFAVKSDLKLQLVPPDHATAVESDYEVWELDDDRCRPVDIVDEALVMAMPMVPRHEDDGNCTAAVPAGPARGSDTVRPFADLRSKMRK
jgi:uncharacterized protein